MDKTQGKFAAPPLQEDETADALPNGLRVLQKKRGNRFSLDAFLLASFVGPGRPGAILDLGTGSGVLALLLSGLRPGSRFLGVEIQPALVDMARRTVAWQGLGDQVVITQGDVRQIEARVSVGTFDMVVTNPPYRRPASGMINPNGEKALARHEILGNLDDFLRAAAYALRPGGRVYLVYPARRMATLLADMRQHRLEPKRCRLVHSFPEKRGEFILTEGVAGGGEEMTVLPPLYIYHPDGTYSSAMQGIFNDLAASAGGDGGISPEP